MSKVTCLRTPTQRDLDICFTLLQVTSAGFNRILHSYQCMTVLYNQGHCFSYSVYNIITFFVLCVEHVHLAQSL